MKKRLNGDYDFICDTVCPNQILQNICEKIGEITKGFVIAHFCEYNGRIESYNQIGEMSAAMALLTENLKTIGCFEVQSELGEVGQSDFKYEVYLTASQIRHYKYRVLFASHGISGYPVKVVLEQHIADEINEKENSAYIFQADDEEKLTDLLLAIFNSQIIHEIIQDLIYACCCQKLLKKETAGG